MVRARSIRSEKLREEGYSKGRGKLLSGIKSMYDSSACVKVGESEQFRIDRVRQGCIMSSWLFNVYMGEGDEDGYGKEGSKLLGEWERVEIAWPLVSRLLCSI